MHGKPQPFHQYPTRFTGQHPAEYQVLRVYLHDQVDTTPLIVTGCAHLACPYLSGS